MKRLGILLTAALAFGCNKPKAYTTTMEIMQIQVFGQDPKVPGLMDLELRYADCPGDARRIVRADKEFAKCNAGALKKGEKVPVELDYVYDADREQYRVDFKKIGACAVKPDPKDEANYEMVQDCHELTATGVSVGVHCDRTRGKDLVAKCPWMYRK